MKIDYGLFVFGVLVGPQPIPSQDLKKDIYVFDLELMLSSIV